MNADKTKQCFNKGQGISKGDLRAQSWIICLTHQLTPPIVKRPWAEGTGGRIHAWIFVLTNLGIELNYPSAKWATLEKSATLDIYYQDLVCTHCTRWPADIIRIWAIYQNVQFSVIRFDDWSLLDGDNFHFPTRSYDLRLLVGWGCFSIVGAVRDDILREPYRFPQHSEQILLASTSE
jgi:hypothetical protein